ncbi:MAG: hypothetical protein VX278_18470 [Myxococcota bacterium]|nr:hypothetical protein [Myxococcota bacterium]
MRILLSIGILSACSEYNIDSVEKYNGAEEEEEETETEVTEETPEPEDEPTPEPEAPIEDGTPPVAVCDVSPNPVNPPFEVATWDGSGSYDLYGSPLSYQWELISSPEASAMTAFDSFYANDAVMSDFMPDVAGEYLGRLTVTNQEGLSDTCDALLEAVPAENLWIEMYWEHSGDDMDLHLIAPGANWSSSTTTDQDCYYANCVWSPLDWGQVGYAGDDPSLDLDDISNIGPENINISNPESTGLYTVVVHDYPGSVYSSPNNVTINIYLNGSMVWSATKSITVEDSYTPYAQIDWANNTIIPM